MVERNPCMSCGGSHGRGPEPDVVPRLETAAGHGKLARMGALDTAGSATSIEAEQRRGAHNYHPLPVVLSHGEGVWVHDLEGRRYFDALSAYSALNFGHRHPRLVQAATEQLGRLTLTSRAFHNDQ